MLKHTQISRLARRRWRNEKVGKERIIKQDNATMSLARVQLCDTLLMIHKTAHSWRSRFITSTKPFIHQHEARTAATEDRDEIALAFLRGERVWGVYWPIGKHKLTNIRANIFLPLVLQMWQISLQRIGEKHQLRAPWTPTEDPRGCCDPLHRRSQHVVPRSICNRPFHRSWSDSARQDWGQKNQCHFATIKRKYIESVLGKLCLRFLRFPHLHRSSNDKCALLLLIVLTGSHIFN